MAAALCALAFGVRALPAASQTGERLVGTDAYYHLRRVIYTLANFPHALGFDRYLHHPRGARPIWPVSFDWLLAAVLRPWAGADDPARVERLAALAPPVLGAATVAVTFALARRHLERATAALAGGLLAVLSGHAWYSQIGFVDHHAAVALLATALLAAGMALAAAPAARPASRTGRQRAPVGAGVLTGALGGGLLVVWPGGLLHLGLVHAGLLLVLASRTERRAAAALATALAVAHGVALAIVLPTGLDPDWLQWSAWSPVVLSRFQPWLFAAGALHAATCAALFAGRGPAGATRARRAGLVAGTGAVALAASALLLPGLSEGALDAWRWMAKTEAFQAQVGESLPLFSSPRTGPTTRIAELRLGRLLYALPLALAALPWAARRHRAGGPLILLALFTLGLAGATLAQRRFFNTLCVGLALCTAAAVVEATRRLVGRLARAGRPGRLARALPAAARRPAAGAWTVRLAMGALVLWLVAPTLPAQRAPLAAWSARLRGEPPRLGDLDERQIAMVESARWLGAHTPATSGWLDADVAPEYGVMAPWSMGHAITYRARRPTVVDNFGDDLGPENFAAMEAYFGAPSESAGSALLERLAVRYVVVWPGPGWLRRQLSLHDGAGLVRHRLRWVGEGGPASRHRIFEHVAGARVVGRARPGSLVEARLPLRTNRGRALVWTGQTTAGASSRYVLRVPYATPLDADAAEPVAGAGGRAAEPAARAEADAAGPAPPPGEVRATGPLRVVADGIEGTVAVPEAAVRGGGELAGPGLRGG